jgi:hypothetical protein
MPIVNSNQARVEMSAAQAEEFARVVMERLTESGGPGLLESGLPPMLYVEETNLENTIVVGGKGMPMTLIDHFGESIEMRGKNK